MGGLADGYDVRIASGPLLQRFGGAVAAVVLVDDDVPVAEGFADGFHAGHVAQEALLAVAGQKADDELHIFQSSSHSVRMMNDRERRLRM